MSAERKNKGKSQLSEIFKFDHALVALAAVMEEGAKKYSRDNWLKGEKEDQEYFDCIARHLKAMVNGEKWDPDLGVLHAAQVAWNALAYIRLNCIPEDAEVMVLDSDNWVHAWIDDDMQVHDTGMSAPWAEEDKVYFSGRIDYDNDHLSELNLSPDGYYEDCPF